MKLLVDVTKGWKYIDGIKDDLITGPTGNMTHFPLCCSTGVLKQVGAYAVKKVARPSIEQPTPFKNVLPARIKSEKYIHEIIRAAESAYGLLYPYKVGRWFCMSQIHAKVADGADDGGTGGYTRFKVAQVTMFDRINSEKKDKRFKFSGYNTVWSVDQFMDWLESTDGKYGEVVISKPMAGAHGAAVRGCIFTPDPQAIEKYHDKRVKRIREHILAYVAWAKKGKKSTAVDKVAASW